MHFSIERLGFTTIIATALVTAACGSASSEHPEVAGEDDVEGRTSQPAVTDTAVDDSHPAAGASSTSSTSSTSTPTIICAVGATRECRRYWVDSYNDKHCTAMTQFCRADGLGWLECGERPTEVDASTD